MGLQAGFDYKFYYNTGTDAVPVWVLLDIIGDVSIGDIGANDVEVKLRAAIYTLSLPGMLKNGSFEFSMANNIGHTSYDLLRADALSRGIRQYASVNGAIASDGTEGMKAFAYFSGFPWNKALEELSDHECVLRFAYYEESDTLVPPEWLVIST